jgi:hypothetical protein
MIVGTAKKKVDKFITTPGKKLKAQALISDSTDQEHHPYK